MPNGRELDDPHYLYKLVWLERLRATIGASDVLGPVVCAGDFNVAPTDLDIYDPARWRRRTHASPPERAAIAALCDIGLRDVTREHRPEPELYTWWSYRPGQFEANRGLRIDLALCSEFDLVCKQEGVCIDGVDPLEQTSRCRDCLRQGQVEDYRACRSRCGSDCDGDGLGSEACDACMAQCRAEL